LIVISGAEPSTMKPDQLSHTAAFVAIKFYGLTRIESYRSLFDEQVIRFYEQMIPQLPAPLCYYHYWLKFGWVRALYTKSEELLLPGDLMHVVARKWWVQRLVDKLISKDYEQLVVLGAGFDHLAYYYSKDLPCFEIDTYYMARLKQQFLYETYPADRHPEIIKAHFPNDDLGSIFQRRHEIDPHKKTVVVAEGFFDYLNRETVSSSLIAIRNHFYNGAALVTTHFALDELSAFHRRVFKSSVSLVGEKLRFDISVKEFKALLTSQGYEINCIHNAQEMKEEIQKTVNARLPVLNGFYILSGIVNHNS
jgi:O-methyltransferase involved in polyketide biosynthesis